MCFFFFLFPLHCSQLWPNRHVFWKPAEVFTALPCPLWLLCHVLFTRTRGCTCANTPYPRFLPSLSPYSAIHAAHRTPVPRTLLLCPTSPISCHSSGCFPLRLKTFAHLLSCPGEGVDLQPWTCPFPTLCMSSAPSSTFILCHYVFLACQLDTARVFSYLLII